jgi:hypothetical protein
MKPVILLSLAAGLAIHTAHAQTQADQYSVLEAQSRAHGLAKLQLLPGPSAPNSQQAAEVTKVATYDTEADALNYLSSQGWEVLGLMPLTVQGTTTGARYCLRRRQTH